MAGINDCYAQWYRGEGSKITEMQYFVQSAANSQGVAISVANKMQHVFDAKHYSTRTEFTVTKDIE